MCVDLESCNFAKFIFSSNNFIIDSLYIKIISSANRDSFTSSFPIWMSFISFSCLNALVRMHSKMLNESDESRHLCPVLDHRRKGFHVLPLGMALGVGFSQMTFIKLRKFLPIPSIVKYFIIKGCWILSDASSASDVMTEWLFPPSF